MNTETLNDIFDKAFEKHELKKLIKDELFKAINGDKEFITVGEGDSAHAIPVDYLKKDNKRDKQLQKKNNGSIYKGKTWKEIFEKRLNPNESKSWWIEKVYTYTDSLLDEGKLSGYQLKSEEGYKTSIPKELNEYIEEKFDTSDKYINKAKTNKNYSSYNDYEKEFSQYIENEPEEYKINDLDSALKDLGVTKEKPIKITNPYETVDIDYDSVYHIIKGGGDSHPPDKTRYKSMNKMLATVKDPNLITEDKNGDKRYFKLFKDNNKIKRQFVVLFDRNNIPTVHTTMPVNKDKAYFLREINKGIIKYKKGQTGAKK